MTRPDQLEQSCGSEAGSYLRLIDFVDHSTLGLRVMKKKKTWLNEETGWLGASPPKERAASGSLPVLIDNLLVRIYFM